MSTVLAAPAATIVDNRTGEAQSIDETSFKALRYFLRALGAAYADDANDADTRLTTGQAAQIVGASPKTIARLIDSGKLKGTRSGAGRRYVMLSDLLDFDAKTKANRHANLEKMRAIADEEGLYDESYNAAIAEYLRSFE